MKVIVKYEIKSHDWLEYGMFETMKDMIPNLRIQDRKVPLGGIASNLYWLKKDVHRATDEIKQRFSANDVEYVLFELPMSEW